MSHIGKKIIAAVILLVLMALLPFAASKCSDTSKRSPIKHEAVDDKTDSTSKNTSKSDNEILCGLTVAACKKDYCDEAVKAIAILLNTDYSVNPDSFDLNNEDVYIEKEGLDNSGKEFYSRIERIVNSNLELYLTVNNKKVYIPYKKSSCGYTLDSKDCEYIISVASPWDCFSSDYSENSECVGVSLDGVDYLCKNGASAEGALKWYLNSFEVS